MSKHKYIDRICVIAVVISLLLSLLIMNGETLGISQSVSAMGYEKHLFDTSKVHTIDIIMDDWNTFLDTAQSEEYSECAVIIDGEAYKNVGIRGKGNTSLSTVSSMDSERYSFKIEFDHYDENKSYYGLDKLSLNNIIQDNTYMKDYLTYRMMNEFGVNAPLCSYVYITVKGEDWGLYLAVEGVEEAFLERNYSSNYGELYKPDSLSMGGGSGNGMDFKREDFMNKSKENSSTSDTESDSMKQNSRNMPQGSFAPPDMQGKMPDDFEMPENFDFSASEGDRFEMPDNMGGDMGSDDVKLQYIDDNANSYSNIFENAKTDITESDKNRLIASLKSLSENSDIESVVDTEKVIRYFVVHNFVCNGDSYTGSMIHNYYLYEKDGQLSMIPWDYNLAFGTFQSGDAASQVNSPIDTPVSGDMSDRPMINWIFENDEYTEMYHQYFAEFLSNVDITGIIDEAEELIAPYVEKDPTKFCSYEEFETGVSTIRSFCELRAESIHGQLEGNIPSTSEGQSADGVSLIDASFINLSDMGTMNMGGMDKGSFGGRGQTQMKEIPQDGMQPPEGVNGEMRDFGDMELPADENNNSVMQNSFGENAEIPNEDNREAPDFNNMQSQGSNTAPYILLGISAVLLGGGLLFAFGFKR